MSRNRSRRCANVCRLQGVGPINVINQMLIKLEGNKVLAYKDLLVPSAKMKDGIKLLGEMLALVRKAGL